jgi:hypothetical protein
MVGNAAGSLSGIAFELGIAGKRRAFASDVPGASEIGSQLEARAVPYGRDLASSCADLDLLFAP